MIYVVEEPHLHKASHEENNEASKEDWTKIAEILALLRSPECVSS